jgi:hypothetical protein
MTHPAIDQTAYMDESIFRYRWFSEQEILIFEQHKWN